MNLRHKLSAVMLVDDEPADNYFHQRIIRKAGITDHIVVKENGEEALSYLSATAKGEAGYPELIFLDINMPLMNGWAFLQAYKQLPAEKKGQIVIVMLTTSPDPSDQAKAAEVPEVLGFRNKPLSQEMLEEILRSNFPSYF